jgi:HEAT repeat protein
MQFFNIHFLLTLVIALYLPPLCAETLAKRHSCPSQALYLAYKGQIDLALTIYEKYFQETQTHDTDFLQHLGLSLLEQGARDSDVEIQVMSVFGAGIAMNETALPILAKAVTSPVPQLQLIALNFLARHQHDEADKYILQGLRSNYLLVRLEALHQMALKKIPRASNHIESLMGKVEPDLVPLFPQLYALVDDAEAIKMLRKLLNHSNETVRIAAIISTADAGRDDLLPKIRALSTHASPAQQEACALALGILHDESSIPRLTHLSRHASISTVRLAAFNALYSLGRIEGLEGIKVMAKSGDLFAINALGEHTGTADTLALLLQNPDFSIRINTAIALLKLQDVRCLPLLSDIFIKDAKDLVFIKGTSQGKGFIYWKPVASAREQFSDSPIELELSLNLRESLLEMTADLPEDCFLGIVKQLFDAQQNDLVPLAIQLLEKQQTEKSICFLKGYLESPGAPLIRNYCNLALYRLGETGPYSQNLAAWTKAQAAQNLIQLRPLVPWELDDNHALYQITPHETSRLLVETFEALTRKQDNDGINCLLEAIKNGNNKNKYALAGLLIRASL